MSAPISRYHLPPPFLIVSFFFCACNLRIKCVRALCVHLCSVCHMVGSARYPTVLKFLFIKGSANQLFESMFCQVCCTMCAQLVECLFGPLTCEKERKTFPPERISRLNSPLTPACMPKQSRQVSWKSQDREYLVGGQQTDCGKALLSSFAPKVRFALQASLRGGLSVVWAMGGHYRYGIIGVLSKHTWCELL